MPLTVALAVLVVMIIVLLAVGLIWYLMPIFGFRNGLNITQRKDLVQGLASVVQALAVVLTGTVGLIGLLFTWRNLSQTRESTQRSLELTEQGQITERFTRAIDQLGETDDNGDPRLEIRLGGIYALERIDKESPERAYHPTVMEVLTAYVRQNAARSPEEATPIPPSLSKGLAADGDVEQFASLEHVPEGITPASFYLERAVANARRIRYITQPRADIRAILDVLRRRGEQSVPDKYRVNLDLQRTRLEHAELQGVDLRVANLWYASLRVANLRGADLQRADLRAADLRAADLVEANLSGADLSKAEHLTQTQLEQAIGDKYTQLPFYLKPPEHWGVETDEQGEGD